MASTIASVEYDVNTDNLVTENQGCAAVANKRKFMKQVILPRWNTKSTPTGELEKKEREKKQERNKKVRGREKGRERIGKGRG